MTSNEKRLLELYGETVIRFKNEMTQSNLEKWLDLIILDLGPGYRLIKILGIKCRI